MARRTKIYEGKAKILYEGTEPGTVIQYFKDDATAFNGEKHDVIAGKGVLNNRISAHLMTKLEAIGIPTHFMRSINMREQLVRSVDVIPIELVVRNIAAYVTSPAFEGKSRVQQHQMVYAALKDTMDGELHALALQTSVPE